MSPERHQARHAELHEALNELVGDFLLHHPYPSDQMPNNTTVMELMIWSAEQVKNATDPREGERAHVYTVCSQCGASITEQ
jgi:hypothetical protein